MSYPKCSNCRHAMKVERRVLGSIWARGWFERLLLLNPFTWVILGLAKLVSAVSPDWCNVAFSLTGFFYDYEDGPSCRKMRLFGACGVEGKLFEPKDQ